MLEDIDHLTLLLVNHVSADPLQTCKDIINKLLMTVEENLNTNDKSGNSLSNTLSSLELLSKLYLKLLKEGRSEENFENLDVVVLCNKLSTVGVQSEDENITRKILEIFQSLLKIEFLSNDSNKIINLTNFYIHNINLLEKLQTKENFNKLEIIFIMRLLVTFYTTLADISKDKLSHEQINNFNNLLSQSNPNVNECKVFVNLICSDIGVNPVQMILQLVIKYHNYSGRKDLVKLLVDKILTCFESGINDKLENILLVLCGLSESHFLDVISNSEDVYFILDNACFWQFIQLALLHKSSSVRKQGMYLFRKTINLFNSYKSDCPTKHENSVDSLKKKDLEGSIMKVEYYNDILTILEFLEEQQFHIVQPIFDKICDYFKQFAFLNKKDKGVWVALIYERAFMHENIKVTKLALDSLTTLPKVYFTDDSTVKRISKLLMQTINNIDLYYADGMAISIQLINIFNRIIVSANVFCVLIKEICNHVWSPEALFFVSYALPKIKHCAWKEEEICELTRFVSKAFETYNKTIKLAIQNHFAECIINLTNVAFVSLDKIVLLLSKLCIHEFFPKKIVEIKNWLVTNFVKEEAVTLMQMLQKDELPKEFNAETIGFMCFFFYYTFGSGSSDPPQNNCFVSEYLIQTFSTFEDLNKRLYISEASCQRNLLVVYGVMKTCTNYWDGVFDTSKLLKVIVPFLEPIKKFILHQIKLCKTLQDYDLCRLMIKIVKLSSKIELFLDIPFDFYVTEIVQNFLMPHFLSLEELPYMQAYVGIKILQVEIQNKDCLSSLYDNKELMSYLEKNLNTPLKKEEEVASKDMQILWGKLNSKYIKAKWIIFEKFVVENKIYYELENGSAEKMASLCFDGFNVGDCGILCPAMRTMKIFIYLLNDHEKVEYFINFLWSLINERRKTKNFKVYVQLFVELVFQDEHSLDRPELINVLMRYSNLLFEDSSTAVANIFMQHMYHPKLSSVFTDVITNVFLRGLTYGFIMRKDKKLVKEIVSFIESENTCPVIDFITNSEIRAKAVVGILNPPKYFKMKDLTISLIKIYTEINENKNRYFGNSLVHKVKLRVMQALLVMKNFQSKEIEDFVIDCIENENSQPSVRYLQEWYFTFLPNSYEIVENKLKTREAKPKTICSLISIFYHLCFGRKGLSLDQLWILMPFTMDQHFEVRLCSRVLIMQMFKKNLFYIDYEYKRSYELIKNMFSLESIEREARGNEFKIFQKLKNNFFFSVFNCQTHFSLETIFMDMPRLSNVGSEEWIPPRIFKNLTDDLPIHIENVDSSLRTLDSEPWLSEKFHDDFSPKVDETSELYLNYQKKMVPDCDRNLSTSSGSHITNARGSLIVVASLIDRIPNLGGLARTCEIFGVSELVINSLKHVEMKEFTSLSVTAEKWINIKEVKVQNLQEYLVKMKESSYTIIGAEQTTQSKPLSSVKFPKESLLLLGNEKKGIPPNLLPYLDICVEIPQKGIIRSLNVHVSGALFIWEFAKQNLFSS